MASWPSSLPQYALADSYQESPRDILVRTPMDAGPEKRRPRYSAKPIDVSFALLMSSAQIDTFETFFEDTLNWGTDSFDWIHQRTLVAVTYEFASRPSYQPISSRFWRVPLDLVIWP